MRLSLRFAGDIKWSIVTLVCFRHKFSTPGLARTCSAALSQRMSSLHGHEWCMIARPNSECRSGGQRNEFRKLQCTSRFPMVSSRHCLCARLISRPDPLWDLRACSTSWFDSSRSPKGWKPANDALCASCKYFGIRNISSNTQIVSSWIRKTGHNFPVLKIR